MLCVSDNYKKNDRNPLRNPIPTLRGPELTITVRTFMRFLSIISIYIATVLLSAQQFHAQWHSISSVPLGAATSPTGQYSLAVGELGSLLFSSDFQASWLRPATGRYFTQYDAAFLDDRVLVLEQGNILSVYDLTMNRFDEIRLVPDSVEYTRCARSLVGDIIATWGESALSVVDASDAKQITIPDSVHLSSALFRDRNSGVIAVDRVGLFRTDNGGQDWSTVYEDTNFVGNDLAMTDDGRVVISVYDEKSLLVSKDAGENWSTIPSPFPVHRITLIQDSLLVIATNDALNGLRRSTVAWRSLTEGGTWDSLLTLAGCSDLASGPGRSILATFEFGSISTLHLPDSLAVHHQPMPPSTSVRFVSCGDTNTCLSGAALPGRIHRSHDRGVTWQATNLKGFNLFGLGFPFRSFGFVVPGRFDGFYQTEDGGQTFDYMRFEVVGNVPERVEDVQSVGRMSTAGSMLMIGTRTVVGGNAPPAYLLTTEDTLSTLSFVRNLVDTGFSFHSNNFENPCLGYYSLRRVSDVGSGYDFRLYSIADNGREILHVLDRSNQLLGDWNLFVESCDRVFRTSQLDDTTREESAHMLMESTDRGRTWEPFYRFDGPVNLSFLSDSVWIAASNKGRIWTSYDAGASWELERIDPVPTVVFPGGITFYPELFDVTLLPDSITVLLRGSFGLFFRKQFEQPLSSVDGKRSRSTVTSISVRPSITHQRASVTWSGPTVRRIELFDMLGTRRDSRPVPPGSRTSDVDLSQFPTGVYQIILLDASGDWVGTTRVQRR